MLCQTAIIVTTSSTLNVYASCTLDTGGGSGISWNNVSVGTVASCIITLNSFLTVTGTLNVTTLGPHDVSFAGSAGFTCGTFAMGGFQYITLLSGQTYTVTSAITVNCLTGAHGKITSSHATNKVTFRLGPGATQAIAFCDAVRVDSSAGQTIYSAGGTLTTSLNWINVYPVNAAFNDPTFRIVKESLNGWSL
jgi:hypothetical protein